MRLRHGGSTGACRTTIRGRYGATVLSSMYRGCCCCDLVDESRPTTSGGGCGNQGYTVLYQYTFTAACSRALSLSLSLDPGLGTSVPLRACERRACVLRAPCALRVRVMRGLLIEQRGGGRHTCHGSSPSNPKHAYFTVFQTCFGNLTQTFAHHNARPPPRRASACNSTARCVRCHLWVPRLN